MSDLQNLTPANTYKGLLQVGDYTNGVDSTVKAVLDGEGTTSALAIGTTKVGIGTTSPSQELDVNGDIASTTLTASGAVTAGSVSTSGAVEAGSIDVSGNVVADEYALDQTGSSSSAVAIHAPATNELAIRTNSTEAMRIDSSGQIGIGTTSPSANLEIFSAVKPIIRLDGTGNNAGQTNFGEIQFYNRDGSADGPNIAASIHAESASSAGAGGVLVFSTEDGGADSEGEVATPRMTIAADGNVGIGFTSPGAKLEVSGNIASTTSSNAVYANSNQGLNGALKLRNEVESGGLAGNNVGIVFQNYSTGNSFARISYIASVQEQDSARYSNLVFGTDDGTGDRDEKMRIASNGNVGIGTASPSAPLEVTSTTGGVIMPRMNTTQMNAISSPIDGEMIYNTTENKFYGRANGAWTALH